MGFQLTFFSPQTKNIIVFPVVIADEMENTNEIEKNCTVHPTHFGVGGVKHNIIIICLVLEVSY